MISLYVGVTTTIRGVPVETIGESFATWEGRQHVLTKKNERFGSLNSSGSSEVKVSLEEKLNGPSGSYSSVGVRIEVTSRCDQTDAAVAKATEILFEETSKALEHYMTPAYNLLLEHIERHGANG